MGDKAQKHESLIDDHDYHGRLKGAYERRYAEGSDVWTDEAAMAEVGILFSRWIGKPSKRVLDVGAGRGRDALLYASLGHDVTAVELVAQPPNIPSSRTARLTFIQDDIRNFAHSDGFDVICDNGFYHHELPSAQKDYLSKINSLMRTPTSFFCLSVFASTDGNGSLMNMPDGRMRRNYAFDELSAELRAASFSVGDFKYLDRRYDGLRYLAVLAFQERNR